MALNVAVASTINDLPEVILSNIFALVSDTRARNSLSLVCQKFRSLERATRWSLALRGNAKELHMIPRCFGSVTHLDLSHVSPWGHALLPTSESSLDPYLLAFQLRVTFPLVTSLTVYARSASTLQVLAPQWPRLRHVKLVRWHQRPQSPAGADFVPLMEKCELLSSLDLSEFYYWTEDLPPVLQAYPNVAKSLTKLDLLTTSFSEGFKDHEIRAITDACPNLKQLLIFCMFDPRYIGFVGDEVLLAIASNCPNLTVLHLAEPTSFSRGDPNDAAEDARISRAVLIDFFSGLRFLEELVMDVCNYVRDSGLALEVLGSKCPRLRSIKLGHFHGMCLAVGSQLDGIALCQGLETLSIKNSPDLTDMGLIEIARGCCKLAMFHVHGCSGITASGVSTMATLLSRTLVDVSISSCENFDAAMSLRALEPIRERIRRLHIDCIWNGLENLEDLSFDLNELDDDAAAAASVSNPNDNFIHLLGNDEYEDRAKKKCKYWSVGECSNAQQSIGHSNGNGNGNGYECKSWNRLQYLSLWIGVGELLTPLPRAGLEDCPNLEEIRIKVEGDCRKRHKPKEQEFGSRQEFGLNCLVRYPKLSKMKLDCGDTIGFAFTAPSGQMDLSLWERFFLRGIGDLRLEALDYWPPQDQDVNRRSLSLPAAGLLGECISLRKLFIHGTMHEHFIMFLLKIDNLRDVQLREDYYPAPDDDMSTEMRVLSCCRFEEALNRRQIPD